MIIYTVYISMAISTSLAGDLPSYFPRCHVDDENLNGCLLNATETVRPYLKKGIPELSFPSFDPLVIPEISIKQGTEAINYKLTLINSTISGMANYIFKELQYDPKNYAFHGKAMFNSLSMVADYEINGNILFAPITGNGNFKSQLGRSSGTVDATGCLVKRKGQNYYQLKDVKATIAMADAKMYFDGLFGGNKELARATNNLLNQHSDELIKEISPAVEKVAADIVRKLMMGISKTIPYEKFLPPSH